MKSVLLYSTLGCHLCEVAKEVAWPVLRPLNLTLVEVDIVDSEDLMERYALRIPVLKVEGVAADLAWPFDARALEEYLHNAA